MKRIPSKGAVLAAGGGVRLAPLTATRPKPMLPIAGKPLLEYNLAQLADAGVSEIVVLISPQGQAIKEHFGDRFRGLDLRYVVQPDARGTGEAVRLLRDCLGGEWFFCIFGDNITAWPVARLLPAHRAMKACATLAVFHAPDPRRHGVVELDGRRVRRIVERPEHPRSDLASAGMFLFEPEIFEALDAVEPAVSGELQLPDAVQHLISQGRTVAHEILDQWRLNVNTPADLLEANHHMLDRDGQRLWSAGIAPPVAAADRPVIEAGARLGPYVSCGSGCVIGSGARVSESILLDSVTVESGAEVYRSILGDRARVAPAVRVHHQVVADGAVCE